MPKGVFKVPAPFNEPVLSYAPGTPERESLQAAYKKNFNKQIDIPMFINGKEVRRYTGLGTATPDHVIRVKPFPLVITPKPKSAIEDFKKLAEKNFKDYRKKYIKYFIITFP